MIAGNEKKEKDCFKWFFNSDGSELENYKYLNIEVWPVELYKL